MRTREILNAVEKRRKLEDKGHSVDWDAFIHRLRLLTSPGARCPGCSVPVVLSRAQEILDNDGDEHGATMVRLAAGQIVGDDGMEKWLQCEVCQ